MRNRKAMFQTAAAIKNSMVDLKNNIKIVIPQTPPVEEPTIVEEPVQKEKQPIVEEKPIIEKQQSVIKPIVEPIKVENTGSINITKNKVNG
jgi:hypothetical protein